MEIKCLLNGILAIMFLLVKAGDSLLRQPWHFSAERYGFQKVIKKKKNISLYGKEEKGGIGGKCSAILRNIVIACLTIFQAKPWCNSCPSRLRCDDRAYHDNPDGIN